VDLSLSKQETLRLGGDDETVDQLL